MNQGAGNESLFMFECKQHVKDCYRQEWTDSVKKNSKLWLFRNLKIEITTNLYLSSQRNIISVIAIDILIFLCNVQHIVICEIHNYQQFFTVRDIYDFKIKK